MLRDVPAGLETLFEFENNSIQIYKKCKVKPNRSDFPKERIQIKNFYFVVTICQKIKKIFQRDHHRSLLVVDSSEESRHGQDFVLAQGTIRWLWKTLLDLWTKRNEIIDPFLRESGDIVLHCLFLILIVILNWVFVRNIILSFFWQDEIGLNSRGNFFLMVNFPYFVVAGVVFFLCD